MNNRFTVTGSNIVFFLFTVLYLVFQVILLVLELVFGAGFIDSNIYGILLVNEYILILIPVLVYALTKRVNFKETFRLNKPGLLPVILIMCMSLPAYLAASMLNSIVVYLLQFIGEIPRQPIPVPGNLSELIVGILIVAVSPGICEEMMHRGMLLSAYERRGSFKAIAITSVFFGLFHFDVTNFLGPVFLGLIIGYYVIRTNSIFAGMLAHFLNNTIAEVLQFIARNEPVQKKVAVTTQELVSVIMLGIVCIIIVSFLIYLFSRVTEKSAVIRPAISSVRNDIVSVISHWPIIVILAIYVLMFFVFLLSIIASKFNGLLY